MTHPGSFFNFCPNRNKRSPWRSARSKNVSSCTGARWAAVGASTAPSPRSTPCCS
ncbi:hypothetical protein [Lysobacter gummosus]|uniref:hypothetical protein n=1 Tax=Lysobacter gummosus TaxID=262324 RepID=UPI00362B6B2D